MSPVFVGRTVSRNAVLPANYTVFLQLMYDELAGEVTARMIFVNAAQAIVAGASVDNEVRVSAAPDPDFVHVEVRDNGGGIPARLAECGSGSERSA